MRCGDTVCIGTGPNKRLAKRAAAEAMLSEIGYVKPLPAPGKSLLKKKNAEPQMVIGVFDPNELVSVFAEREQVREKVRLNELIRVYCIFFIVHGISFQMEPAPVDSQWTSPPDAIDTNGNGVEQSENNNVKWLVE